MNLSTKILIFIGSILVISGIGFLIYSLHESKVKQDALQNQVVQMKQLADNISRAQATWATKEDLDALAKQNNVNLQVIRDDLANYNATLTGINVATVKSIGQAVANVGSTSTTPNKDPSPTLIDNFGYLKNRQVLTLNEQFSNTQVPIGEIGFSAWQEKPWDLNIYSREYKAITVLGTDQNQRQYAYNKFSVNTNGKDYAVNISNNTFSQEYPDPKFTLFNPRIYLGISGGININQVRAEATPDLNFAFMSYGRYLTAPDLTFLQLGIGYGIDSKRPQVTLTPITYNIGQHIPLMNNLHIGPVIQAGTNGNITAGIGLRLGM